MNPSNCYQQTFGKCHQRSIWSAGGLNAAEQLGIDEWPKMQRTLTSNIGYGAERTHFIRGFYNESLVEGLGLATRIPGMA